MNDAWSLYHGLFREFTWVDGKGNALLNGAPSWTYLLGVWIHFILVMGLTLMIFFSLIWFFLEWFKRSFKKSQPNVRIPRWESGALREPLSYGFIFLMILAVFSLFSWYEPQRLFNGIWLYQYFDQKDIQEQFALIVDAETSYGKNSYPSMILCLVISGQENLHQVYISNARKSSILRFKQTFKKRMPVKVWLNNEGKIIFVQESWSK